MKEQLKSPYQLENESESLGKIDKFVEKLEKKQLGGEEFKRRLDVVRTIEFYHPHNEYQTGQLDSSMLDIVNLAKSGLDNFGDKTWGVEVIRSWDKAVEYSIAADEEKAELILPGGYHRATFAAHRIHHLANNGQDTLFHFHSQAVANMWSYMDENFKDANIIKQVEEIQSDVAELLPDVTYDFRDAFFDPAWESHYSDFLDYSEGSGYKGGIKELRHYQHLVEPAYFLKPDDGRVVKQTIDTMYLHLGFGILEKKLKEQGVEDPTIPLIALYKEGFWPIGKTMTKRGAEIFALLIPPEGVNSKIRRIEAVVNEIKGVEGVNVKSRLEKSNDSLRTIHIKVDSQKVTDANVEKIAQSAKRAILKNVGRVGMENVDIQVAKKVEANLKL